MPRATPPAYIFNAATAASTGLEQLVEDYRHLILALHTADSANFTIKIQGSISQDKPDFSAAQTPANSWDYIEIKDLEDGTAIDGDTGVAAAGTDDHRLFEVNSNGLRWLSATITARSAGAITLQLKPFKSY